MEGLIKRRLVREGSRTMERYESPEMEITLLNNVDIVTESGDTDLPWIDD